MKTLIYACFLPGSETPDYIGSHAATPPDKSPAMQWRYTHCTYLGQGIWITNDSGDLIGPPKLNTTTRWGALICAMPPAERLNVRTHILQAVDVSERWAAEARAIRQHLPPYNVSLKDGPAERKAKWNAYQRGYRKAYLDRNPDKLEAKRASDRARCAAKRAQAKLLKATGTVA